MDIWESTDGHRSSPGTSSGESPFCCVISQRPLCDGFVNLTSCTHNGTVFLNQLMHTPIPSTPETTACATVDNSPPA